MPSHLIGILSLGPCISFFFSRGSTPLATDGGYIYIYLYYIYRVLDFRVVVFWWRAEGPPENAKTRKFKKTRCRWMHPKTRKSENLPKKNETRKRENLKISEKYPQKNKNPEIAKIWKSEQCEKWEKTRKRENLKIRKMRKLEKKRKRENLKIRNVRKMRKTRKRENLTIRKVWKW